MSLAAGTRVGPYEIVSLLGAGGMGEVYRGRDTKLGRDVAIKILPEHFATDTDRVARFEREAKTLASLNHARIAQIYGFEQLGASSALVMELVAGEDLSDRIKRGPLDVDEALAIAKQIADALDAAHGQGVIHRDLKPANVKITDDGAVKVLDFGLAKAIDPVAGSREPGTGATITSPAMTMQGMILGTAAYMAPEQAKGRPVDKRVDIWAFGCIVYEMVTGQRAFPGEDVSETIASVLKTEPDLPRVPASLRPLLAKCLQKDPRQRLRDIGDVALLIEPAPASASRSGSSTMSWSIATLSVIALIASALVFWQARSGGDATASVIRTTLRFQPGARMQLGSNQPSLAVSPDGKTIVYTAVGPEGTQLWTYSLDGFEPKPLAGTASDGGPRNVFFSPDGQQIGFFAGNQLKRMPISGGTVTVVCDAPFGYGGTWTDRDEMVFVASGDGSTKAPSPLWRVPASGGQRRLAADVFVSYPDALPGGRVVLGVLDQPRALTSSQLDIVTVDIETGEVRPLIAGGTYGRYAATGHVLFLRNGALMATAIDVNARTASERSSVVVSDVFQNPSMASGNYAISRAGTLAYPPGTDADFKRALIMIDAKGERSAVSDERRFFEWPRASPDGQRIAVNVPGWRDTIWILDRARGAMTLLTTGDVDGSSPVWTPDGRRIVMATYFRDAATNLQWIPADGSSPAERLTTSKSGQRPNSITRDGKTLVFEVRGPSNTDLWTLSLEADHTAKPLLDSRFNETSAAVSPNGQWMAFTSDQSGRPEIYLTRFPSVEGRIQVSTAGGRMAVWSPDGGRLYYRAGSGAIMAVDIGAGATPSLSRPELAATLPPAPPTRGTFDVMPDGRLLAVDDENAGGVAAELRIVVNWFDELKRKMAGGAQSSQ